MVHVPGQLDFRIEEKEFPVTVFRRKISSVWDFVEAPGHVAIITRRGKRECALMSIETWACMVYPRVTSRIIINTNPSAKAMVPQLECLPSDISGISSSTTTYIIAPAAKARR